MTEENREGQAVAANAVPPPPRECPIPTIILSRYLRSDGMVFVGPPAKGTEETSLSSLKSCGSTFRQGSRNSPPEGEGSESI